VNNDRYVYKVTACVLNGVRVPGWEKFSVFSKASRKGPGAHLTSYPMNAGDEMAVRWS
jgi:hypothetical protein